MGKYGTFDRKSGAGLRGHGKHRNPDSPGGLPREKERRPLFYPGDFPPICTAEACGFRDMYDELQGKDTEVIGVSMDSDGSHKTAAANHISLA